MLSQNNKTRLHRLEAGRPKTRKTLIIVGLFLSAVMISISGCSPRDGEGFGVQAVGACSRICFGSRPGGDRSLLGAKANEGRLCGIRGAAIGHGCSSQEYPLACWRNIRQLSAARDYFRFRFMGVRAQLLSARRPRCQWAGVTRAAAPDLREPARRLHKT